MKNNFFFFFEEKLSKIISTEENNFIALKKREGGRKHNRVTKRYVRNKIIIMDHQRSNGSYINFLHAINHRLLNIDEYLIRTIFKQLTPQ